MGRARASTRGGRGACLVRWVGALALCGCAWADAAAGADQPKDRRDARRHDVNEHVNNSKKKDANSSRRVGALALCGCAWADAAAGPDRSKDRGDACGHDVN